MCGFVTIHSSGKPLDGRADLMKSMMKKIEARGPDAEGMCHIPTQIIMGHRRLAVIDLKNGSQPMQAEGGRYSLVYNGEIYNFLELRQNLIRRGIDFESFSDTEVLLKLLIADGTEAISKLNGMFAFIFHDRATNEWIAARDSFGIKPLYLAHAGDELVFGSEIKALICHPEIKVSRDETSLQQYMVFQFCMNERTLFSGIEKVKPGYFYQGRGAKIEKQISYWDVNYNVDYSLNEDMFLEQIFNRLEESVALQMRSDVPVGGYLSGGLDSSVVCALAAKRSDIPVAMFHGRFKEGASYDESAHAKAVVEHANGTYHEVIPTAQNFVDFMPSLIYALDEPVAGPGVFPQYCVSKMAREHVTVVLGGQGGDEIFGGYARYLVGYLEQALKGAIMETEQEGKHLVTLDSLVPNLPLLKQYQPMLKQFWSKGLFENMDSRYFNLLDRSQGLESILNPDCLATFDREALFAEFQGIFNHRDTKSYINKMTHFDQKTLLPALLQVEDRVSMAVSLESRVPLLDPQLVDLVTTIPPPMKFQGGRPKHLLKKAARNLLPKSVLHRKDKMGFPVPMAEWMEGGPVREFVGDILLSKRSLERGIYSPDALHKMMGEQGVGGRQLWGALSLELWHMSFIDG